MRKIFIVAAVICLTFSIQSVALKNVDSAQKNVAAPSDSTCDWPMFGRTPDGNRVAPDGCGPKTYKLKKIWVYESYEDSYTITPTISNGKIFFGSEYAYSNLQCLDAETGKELWNFDSDSPFDGAPAVWNGKVYAGKHSKVLYCLDEISGNLIWDFETKWAIVSSPIVYEGKVFVSDEKILYCLDANSGKLAWDFSNNEMYTTVAISNGNVFFGSDKNYLYCLDFANGRKKWDFKCGYEVVASPAILNNRVFFGSFDNKFYCLDANDGKKIWEFETGGFINSTPAIANGNVYFGSWDHNLYCLDVTSGEKKWIFETKRNINSSPAVSNKLVFIGSNDHNFYCINGINGKILWQYETGDDISLTSAAIANNKVYIRSKDQKVYCFGDSGDYKPVPSSIKLNTDKQKIDLCESMQLKTSIFDEFDQLIADAPFQWSVDPPEFGTIDSSGLFTPKKTGKVKITCKSGDLTESITIDVIEFLTVNSESIKIAVDNPKKVASKTIVYANNSDRKLTVDVVSNLGLVTVSPLSFTIEPGKSQEVSVSAKLESFEPVPDTEFIITATYDTCAKQLKGLLSSSLPFACLSTSPDSLTFGMVERGYEKTMSLSVLSEVETKISVSTSEPWISVSTKEMMLKAGVPATIEFKIRASSLPSASRLSGNVIIKSDAAFCNTLTIPLTVQTEESITIKLKIDSKSATINNQKRDLDAPPKIMAGRTMVPLRFISEAFGCNIEWDAKEQKIGILRYDISVNLWIGKDYVEVNGQKLKIDSPPVIVGGRTMVPLRFIAEPFGAKVEWNAQIKEITIIWPKP